MRKMRAESKSELKQMMGKIMMDCEWGLGGGGSQIIYFLNQIKSNSC